MDNLTHTLLGLSLSKAGLDRTTPLATAALVISSNLPDIDVVSRIYGGSLGYLKYHRGITHSLAGLAVLSGLLSLLLILFDRRVRLRRESPLSPARPLTLFLLSYAGGLGHIFMDYTNSYGVRPLLPFSDGWWYGDLTFVVDPWIWLILGSTLVLVTSNKRLSTAIWIVVGILTSIPVVAVRQAPSPGGLGVPPAAKWIWFGGLLIIILGWFKRWRLAGPKLAVISLVALSLYYAGLLVCRHLAFAAPAFASSTVSGESIAVWPTPANPFLWQAVRSSPVEIRSGVIAITSPGKSYEWVRLEPLPADLQAAIAQSETVAEFLYFARVKSATVEATSDGYLVRLRDLRFSLQAVVTLDLDWNVQSARINWF